MVSVITPINYIKCSIIRSRWRIVQRIFALSVLAAGIISTAPRIVGTLSAEITPEMVKGWVEKSISHDYKRAPFRGNEFFCVKGGWNTVGIGTKDYKLIIETLDDLSPHLKKLGIAKFSDNVKMVGAGTRVRKAEDGKEAEYYVYYLTDVGMRGVLAIEARRPTYEERVSRGELDVILDYTVHTFQNDTPTTKEFTLLALPNNGCAVVTQHKLSIVQPGEDGDLHMGSYSLEPIIAFEGGQKPEGLFLIYGRNGNGEIIVGIGADNWRHINLINLTTEATYAVLVEDLERKY